MEAKNFNHIELTKEEELAAFQIVMGEKKYAFFKQRYTGLMLEGKTELEATKQAKEEQDEYVPVLTGVETERCLKQAKEDKFYRSKASAYFESLKEPKKYPVPSKEDFHKDIDERLMNLTDGQIKPSRQLDLLKWYFSKDTRFVDAGYSLSKGIILKGPVGCGKTTLMKAFSKNIYQSYAVVSCRRISSDYKDKGMNGIYKYSDVVENKMAALFYGQDQQGWCFDDLGAEGNRKNFGDELNVMTEIFSNWYDRRGIGFNKIHITTNLGASEIEERYGARIRSRMREMFNLIDFDDSTEDKRK